MNLVVLGRDGVINEVAQTCIDTPAAWRPVRGSLDAIGRLSRAAFRVVVATNQPGVHAGELNMELLTRVHHHMHQQVAEHGGNIEAVFVCPCAPAEACTCRKPQPGMLIEISERLRVSLEDMIVIGDDLGDIEAAHAVGARPILVRTGNGATTLDNHAHIRVTEVYDDLATAVDHLIEEFKPD